jgi:hypothetical protein
MKQQFFPTYGDTDEPAVTEQMKAMREEYRQQTDYLMRRCAALETVLARVLDRMPLVIRDDEIRAFMNGEES